MPVDPAPPQNPYASPTSQAESPSPGNPLLIPGIALLVLSIVFLLLVFVSLPSQVARLYAVDTSTAQGQGELFGGIATLAVWTLLPMTVLLGSIGMLRLRGYRGAMATAIISVIPFCGPCFVLAIPFGIWALVVLCRPDVKERFQ